MRENRPPWTHFQNFFLLCDSSRRHNTKKSWDNEVVPTYWHIARILRLSPSLSEMLAYPTNLQIVRNVAQVSKLPCIRATALFPTIVKG